MNSSFDSDVYGIRLQLTIIDLFELYLPVLTINIIYHVQATIQQSK